MRQVGIINAFWKSASSFTFYKEILEQPFWASIRYFIVLAMLATAAISVRYEYALSAGISKMADWTKKNIPEIRLSKGKASANIAEPLVIESGSSAIIIDTTGKISELDKKYNMGLLVAPDKAVFKLDSLKQNNFQYTNVNFFIIGSVLAASIVKPDITDKNVLEFSKVKNLVFNKSLVDALRKKITVAGLIVLPIIYFLYFMISKLIQAAFFSMIVIFANSTLKEGGITFEKLFNVSIYALTPVTIFMILINVANITVPYIDIIYLFMYVGFLLGAIFNCLPKRPEVANEDKGDWPGF